MAHDALKWAYERPNLTPDERLTLVTLGWRVNPQRRIAWPSQKTLRALTGLSNSTLNRVLRSLEDKGLIQRMDRGGKMTTTYTLGLDIKAPATTPTVGVQNGSTTPTMGVHEEDSLLPQWDTKEKKQDQEQTSKGKEEAPDGASLPPGGTSPEQQEGGMKPMKGVSVLSVVQAAKAEYAEVTDADLINVPRLKGIPTPAGLANCWRRCQSKYVPGCALPLTQKQVGQLKLAQKRVEVPLPTLILAVMQDWKGYTILAEQQTKTFNSPQKPDVGYFLQHVGSAVDFVAQKEQAALEAEQHKAAMAAKLAKPKPAPVQPIANPHADLLNPPKLTLAEFEATMAELEAEDAAEDGGA